MIIYKRVEGADPTDFNAIKKINDDSFEGVERPPQGILFAHFMADDVFVLRDLTTEAIYAFAFVTERGGPYIWSIAVTPTYRGAGCGTQLLQEIEEFYRHAGRQSIGLTCKTTNPAQKLYFDMGYRVEKVAQNYYGLEVDGLFMRRVL